MTCKRVEVIPQYGYINGAHRAQNPSSHNHFISDMSQITNNQPTRFVDQLDRVCHRFTIDGRAIPDNFEALVAAKFDVDAVHRLQLIVDLQHTSDPEALKLGRAKMLHELADGMQVFKRLEFLDVLYMVGAKTMPASPIDLAQLAWFGWSNLFRFPPDNKILPVHNITWLTMAGHVENPCVQANVMTHTAKIYNTEVDVRSIDKKDTTVEKVGTKIDVWNMDEKDTTVEKDGRDLMFSLLAKYGLPVPHPGRLTAAVFPEAWMAGEAWGSTQLDAS